MPELTDLIGVTFEDESGDEFEITDAGAHPNFETARIIARVPNFDEKEFKLAGDSKALDARTVQEKFASGDWEVVDGKGMF